MAQPALLVENVFSAVQFPAHTITANEEATGAQAWRVADGRRSSLSSWTPTTANNIAWVKADCATVRAATMLVLDGHNLAGYPVQYQVSDDDSTYRDVVSATIPAVTAPGSIDDASGVLTEEGVWVIRFTMDAGRYHRFYIPAMGSGLLPQITGLWVGMGLTLEYLDRPFEDDHDTLLAAQVTESDAGWMGTWPIARRPDGSLRIKIASYADYDLVRYHLVGHFGEGRPMWLALDADQGDRTLCVRRPPGRMGFGFGSDGDQWGYRSGRIEWVGHERAQL